MSIKSYISKEEIPHSNWNQNDPNGEGYIEGRICYTTDPIETVFFEEHLSFINGGYSPLGLGEVNGYYIYETTIDNQLIVGDKYKVIIDGNEYVLECYDDGGYPTLGETYNDESNPYDFSIYSFSIYIWVDGNINYLYIIFNTSESRTVKIIHYTAEEDIQLDRRYIKYIPGLKTEGNTYTINNESITSQNGAEIFNDYTNNIATGKYSHAEGYNTIASGEQQHVQGKYNIEDTESKYANIIGNGTSDSNRSNAHTVDWNGNAEYKGDVLANACGGENPISLINIYNKLQALLTVIESATAGQVIIADGNGGITTETIINGNEIEY